MKTDHSIKLKIAKVLSDIRLKGYSSVQPFSIGKVEERMMHFAQVNTITLASDELYMSAKQLQHCMRASKGSKGKPSGKVELLIITQMPPFRTSWLYLVSPFTLQRYDKFPKLPNFLAKI